MQVVDRLAAPSADVRDQPEAVVGDPLGPGDLGHAKTLLYAAGGFGLAAVLVLILAWIYRDREVIIRATAVPLKITSMPSGGLRRGGL